MGVRIPKPYAEEIGISEGTTLEVRRAGRKLVLVPTQTEQVIAACFENYAQKSRHQETKWGAPVGKEA